MKKIDPNEQALLDSLSPTAFIDAKLAAMDDWRGVTLTRLRNLIKTADPDVTEQVKWGGTPVWEHDGIICTGETYKAKIKLTFLKGASLDDPAGLFNASLGGNARRAIDYVEGDTIDETAFVDLIREAVELNIMARQHKGGR